DYHWVPGTAAPPGAHKSTYQERMCYRAKSPRAQPVSCPRVRFAHRWATSGRSAPQTSRAKAPLRTNVDAPALPPPCYARSGATTPFVVSGLLQYSSPTLPLAAVAAPTCRHARKLVLSPRLRRALAQPQLNHRWVIGALACPRATIVPTAKTSLLRIGTTSPSTSRPAQKSDHICIICRRRSNNVVRLYERSTALDIACANAISATSRSKPVRSAAHVRNVARKPCVVTPSYFKRSKTRSNA